MKVGKKYTTEMNSLIHLSIVYSTISRKLLEQDVLIDLADPDESTGEYLIKLAKEQHAAESISSGILEFFWNERQIWIVIDSSRKLVAEGRYKFTIKNSGCPCCIGIFSNALICLSLRFFLYFFR
jgi:hypothetical protein